MILWYFCLPYSFSASENASRISSSTVFECFSPSLQIACCQNRGQGDSKGDLIEWNSELCSSVNLAVSPLINDFLETVDCRTALMCNPLRILASFKLKKIMYILIYNCSGALSSIIAIVQVLYKNTYLWKSVFWTVGPSSRIQLARNFRLSAYLQLSVGTVWYDMK